MSTVVKSEKFSSLQVIDDTVVNSIYSEGNVTIIGDLSADNIVAETDITATAGDITATAGDVVVTAGAVTVTAGDVNITAGDLTYGAATGGVTRAMADVSQLTNITTAVTANGRAGIITTQSATAGAAGATPNTFTVNNSEVAVGDVIQLTIVDYAGTIATNGNPFVIVDNVTAGTFDVIVSNAHGANALSGALQIAYHVIKSI